MSVSYAASSCFTSAFEGLCPIRWKRSITSLEEIPKGEGGGVRVGGLGCVGCSDVRGVRVCGV